MRPVNSSSRSATGSGDDSPTRLPAGPRLPHRPGWQGLADGGPWSVGRARALRGPRGPPPRPRATTTRPCRGRARCAGATGRARGPGRAGRWASGNEIDATAGGRRHPQLAVGDRGVHVGAANAVAAGPHRQIYVDTTERAQPASRGHDSGCTAAHGRANRLSAEPHGTGSREAYTGCQEPPHEWRICRRSTTGLELRDFHPMGTQ